MKKFLLIGGLIFLLLMIMSASEKDKNKINNQAGGQKEPIKETTNGKYLWGIGYFPFNPVFSTADAMAKIKEASDIVYIQRHWMESQNPDQRDFFTTLKDDVSEARKKKLKVYIAFEILSPNRDKLELPSNLSGNFSSKVVQDAFVDMVTKIANEYEPEYFILNVEANTYKNFNPTDYQAFRSTYERAYNAVKSVNSKIKVGVSLVYSDFDNKDCIDSGDIARFRSEASDFTKLDIFAVSTYPMCYITPSKIPDDFLFKIGELSTKPLFISETGWVSKGIIFIGSESNQAKYVEALARSADYAEKNGKDIEAVNYVGLIDPSKEVCDAITTIYPSLSWYCNLSLINLNGEAKPAYIKLKALND
ncbi:MAG: hypothetical protein AAB392_03280 [Patescibacteria group bacterium]